MKKLYVLFAVTALQLCFCLNNYALTLVDKGLSNFKIHVSKSAIPAEKTAAKELQSYIKQISGAELEIIHEASGKDKIIYVGQSKAVRKLLPKIDFKKLQSDEIIIKSFPHALVLSGGRPRGALYAVYSLLEDYFGVRWWTSTESYVPTMKNITVPELDVRYAPVLWQREAHFTDIIKNPEFAVKLKNNGQHPIIPENLGGNIIAAGNYCHSFWSLIPTHKYFKKHPEWFSLVNGKRVGGLIGGQLCLTNEELKQEVIKNALGWLKKNPNRKLIAISQNDNQKYCQCKKCKAVNKTEGSPAGSLLRFVNQVAEAIEKQYPDVMVETFAYQYTRIPPRHTRPRHNVMIRLCSLDCDFSKPLDSKSNRVFRDQIKKWSKITDHLAIWDYAANFNNYLLPHPNTYIIAKNIRFFADNKAIAVFEQGSGGGRYICDNNSDMVQLKAWVTAHLLWNPKSDAKKLIDEFIYGYYGPKAAPYIKKYLTLLNHAAENSKLKVGCYTDNVDWMPLDKKIEAYKLMCKALKSAADNKVYYNRVERNSVAANLALLMCDELAAWNQNPKAIQMRKMLRLDSLLKNTLAILRKNKIKYYREAFGNFNLLKAKLLARYNPSMHELPFKYQNNFNADRFEIPAKDFVLYQKNRLTYIQRDPNAANLTTVMMPNNHKKWGIQVVFPKNMGKWRIFASIRCEGNNKPGNALDIGIYDYIARKGRFSMKVQNHKVIGKNYKLIDLGTYKLDSPNLQLWIAPSMNNNIYKIYVDRIVLIRDIK